MFVYSNVLFGYNKYKQSATLEKWEGNSKMGKKFEELGLNEKIILGLNKQGIDTPTEIQSIMIQPFIEKKDIVAQSETGSGKTLGYLLPLFMLIDGSLRNTQAIILTPTHELAVQVHKQVELLSENSEMGIRSALIIGGASMTRQLERLKEKPHIIVGSSGRILDLIQKKKISAHTVKTIVIDEADRMLDSLNIETVKAVIKTTLKERQLVALSASIDSAALLSADEIMKDYITLRVTKEDKLPENIKHYYIKCDWREKINMVRKIIHGEKPEKTIVFLNNPENIEVTVEKLNFHALKAAGIYGGAYKTERKNAMDDFREGRVKILVASDIGARGLDIAGVTHIINLDIPEEPVYYLHRAGRTGRKGDSGTAISIITEYEMKWIHKYERAFGIHFEQREMTYGKLDTITKGKVLKSDKKLKTEENNKRITKTDENNKPKRTSRKSTNNYIDIRESKKEKPKQEIGFFAKKAEKIAKKQKTEKK